MSLSAHLKGGKQLLQAAPEWAKVTDRVISVLGLNPGTVSEPWLAYSVMLFLNNLYIYFFLTLCFFTTSLIYTETLPYRMTHCRHVHAHRNQYIPCWFVSLSCISSLSLPIPPHPSLSLSPTSRALLLDVLPALYPREQLFLFRKILSDVRYGGDASPCTIGTGPSRILIDTGEGVEGYIDNLEVSALLPPPLLLRLRMRLCLHLRHLKASD